MSQTQTSESTLKPAVFFDRDGVLNKDRGFVYKSEDWEWMDGAISAIKKFNALNYFVFVVTNQSGVGREYYGEGDVKAIHDFMKKELSQNGAHIDAIRYCPHHIEAKLEEYKIDCNWRKPKSGMIDDLLSSFPVDKSKSLLVGDKKTDIEAADNAGINAILFQSGNLDLFLTEAGCY
ncbi:MAG: D,D-heptose 1,7-bisphosphate phosphatase [Woeseiaceae bacterium]|nr:D,D-heptose 1,7-bisphosphate phosphatase [Woeseiaceae bacterium]